MNWIRTLRRLGPDILAVIVLQVLCLFFFWQLYPPNDADQVVVRHDTDFAYQGYNYSVYHAERFADGDLLPLWNPYNMAGSPFLADNLSQAVYPPRWFFLAIFGDGWSYWSMEIEIVAHYMLMSAFMYLLVRRMTGRVLGGLVAAIAYTFSGFMTSYPLLHVVVTEAATWVPLVIWGVFEATRQDDDIPSLDPRRLGWFLVSGIALAISFFAGNPQSTHMTGVFCILYFSYRVYHRSRSWRQWIAGGAIMGITSLGISAVNWLATLEYIPVNTRLDYVDYFAKSAGFTYQNMFQVLWATSNQYDPWYIGMLGTLLIVAAVVFQGVKVRFWLITAIFTFILGFGGKTTIYNALYLVLPGFNLFQHYERALMLATFAAAIMMGWGAISLVEKLRQDQVRWLAGALIVVAVIAGWYFVSIYNISGGEYDTLNKEMAGYTFMVTLIMVAVVLWMVRNPTPGRQAALVALLVFDLFSVSQSSSYVFMRGHPEDVLQTPLWIDDLRPYLEADPFARVDSADYLGPYGSMYRLPDIQGTWLNPLRLSYTNDMRDLEQSARWNLLAVRFVLSETDPPVPAEQILGPYWYFDKTFYVYELADPGPLARLAYGWSWVSDSEAIGVLSAADYPRDDRVVLADPPPIDIPDAERPDLSRITLLSMEPERLRLSAETGETALLLISIPYHPGWRVRSDGRDLDLLRADLGLMAVPLEAGSYDLELVFEPDSHRYGLPITLVASLATAVALGAWLLMCWSRRSRQGRKA